MKKTRNPLKVFKHSILMFVSAFLMTVLLYRSFDLQVINGNEFRVRADDNRFFSQEISPYRGVILDRFGDPVVLNQKRYYYLDFPERVFSTQRPITREEALVTLASNSAHVTTLTKRHYLFPEPLAHVVGYVGRITAEEREQYPDRSLSLDYGKFGLEKIFDQTLQGKPGKATYEVNALGQRQRLVQSEESIPGVSLETTLDPYLSLAAYEALGDHKGSVIVLDAKTGQVLALVNKPSFNPNVMSATEVEVSLEQARQQQVMGWLKDETQPFFNRAVAGVYPPGSVFKIVSALAGLESKAVDVNTTVQDEGVLRVGEYQYGNWYFRQYGRVEGTVNLVRALARSNDIYFYKLGEWVGPNKLAETSRLLGLGQQPAITLYPKAAGLVPDPQWKEQTVGERWFLGNTYHFSIGQGDVLVSPLQVAQFAQVVANQGTFCPAQVVKSQEDTCYEVGLTTENIEIVLQGMLEACSSGGTAFPFFPLNQDRRSVADGEASGGVNADLSRGAVACKTGTAEFGGQDEQGYRNTHGWLMAIIEPQLSTPFAGEQLSSDELATALAATESAEQLDSQETDGVPVTAAQAYRPWQKRVTEKGFPDRVVIVAMVESDETQPFMEGSRDAGPIVKKIVDWMEGRSWASAPAPSPEEVTLGE